LIAARRDRQRRLPDFLRIAMERELVQDNVAGEAAHRVRFAGRKIMRASFASPG
jgi:hypothetical protein